MLSEEKIIENIREKVIEVIESALKKKKLVMLPFNIAIAEKEYERLFGNIKEVDRIHAKIQVAGLMNETGITSEEITSVRVWDDFSDKSTHVEIFAQPKQPAEYLTFTVEVE